ncbi:hypothetical protein Gogos_012007 [Gossypium gossypioides]|uniref:Uncharacterized protein n=1 Tax=Gossypium gossypioides TaxID=34282 RepID=A0A7J9BR93_GOSGO|nr:hypothetical protein [Gossypium gossypioides]
MATTMTLSTRIDELEEELALCRAAVGKGVSSVTLSNEDKMKNYFRAKGIVDDAVKVNTTSIFFTDIALLWWRGKTTNKRQCEIGTW